MIWKYYIFSCVFKTQISNRTYSKEGMFCRFGVASQMLHYKQVFVEYSIEITILYWRNEITNRFDRNRAAESRNIITKKQCRRHCTHWLTNDHVVWSEPIGYRAPSKTSNFTITNPRSSHAARSYSNIFYVDHTVNNKKMAIIKETAKNGI